MSKIDISSVVKIKPPGQSERWYIKKPIDRHYESLDMALKTIERFNTDKDYAEMILASNERYAKIQRTGKRNTSKAKRDSKSK